MQWIQGWRVDSGVTMEGPPHLDAILPADLAACHAMITQLLNLQHQKDRTIGQLEHQLQQLLRRVYGRSAETLDPKQMTLFAQMLQQLQATQPQTPSPAQPAHAPQPPATPPATPPVNPPVNGHGRRRLPADLPRQRIVHDLPEIEKPCPCCGKPRRRIGEDVSEQLEYVPARVFVLQHVRIKYACTDCEQNASEAGPQIVTADKPLRGAPIDKGLAGPGLLACVIVGKYGDHLPLHRIERIMERHGIDISRSTMCDWAAQCADVLRPLYELMVRRVLASKVIHTDDTPVDVLDRKLKQTRTGRFWVYLGDPGNPYSVFDYTPSRSRDGPMRFLSKWNGYLQADAFGGYDGIYAGQAGGSVTEVACWAHARRKFFDARGSDVARSTAALAHIRLLYDVEDQAKELAPAERAVLRRELAAPRLQQFKTWLTEQQAASGGAVLPKSPMGQAITYALNQWDALCVYATDTSGGGGDLDIDNNAAENALRRVALGRKNWLFCGSDNGGRTAAVLFTFIATCQRHAINPFDYLRDVLDRIAATPISKLEELLPGNWMTHG